MPQFTERKSQKRRKIKNAEKEIAILRKGEYNNK